MAKLRNENPTLLSESEDTLRFADVIVAVIFAAVAVFWTAALWTPNSTGVVGHWVVQVAAKWLLGKTIVVLPLFFAVEAFAIFWNKSVSKIRLTLAGLILGAVFVAMTLEWLAYGFANHTVWTVQKSGGGMVGYFGLHGIHLMVGPYGTALVMGCGLLISALMIFHAFVRDRLNRTPEPTEEAATPAPAIENDEADPEMEPPAKLPRIRKPKASTAPLSEPLPSLGPRVGSVEGRPYEFPPITLLADAVGVAQQDDADRRRHKEQSMILEDTLRSFGVAATVVGVTTGPSVTRYELKPGDGVKIAKITSLSKDIALKLAVADVRIEAPIPGKALVGIEVPNPEIDTLTIRTILERTDFFARPSKLSAVVGLTITGEPIIMDLDKMPHILIAGATGSGKSVCVNAIILSILMRATPDEVRFLMIDPKKVELNLYDGIPHLLAPVVTDPPQAAATLKRWALIEMERRYTEFSKLGVKNLEGYNQKAKESAKTDEPFKPLPYIVVIIDELADLMMVAAQDVETTICRLAQMSRATGIHMVIATQRPSVNVVTGLIKANIPSRASFFLQSQIDSRTILDMPGAEKLLGKGDMLYMPAGKLKPLRVQGVYVSEREVKNVVDFLKSQAAPRYEEEVIAAQTASDEESAGSGGNSADDDMYEQAKQIVQSSQYASTSYLQRKLRIGYNRAARLMDALIENGVIQPDAERRRVP